MKKNESILLLEKDQLLRMLYKDELLDEGYTTIFAEDDKDALWKIKEFSPDLFITTYQNPSSESFFDMLWHIREEEQIPILINTAYPQEMIDAKSNKVAECLTKTSDLKALKRKIETLLHLHNS